MYPRNSPSPPRIGVGPVILAADGTVQTSGVSVVVRAEGGAESAGAGTVSYGGTSGIVYYTPTQAETNATAFVVTAYKSNCVPASVTVVTSASATSGRVVPETAPPTAADIADAVWDEAMAGHTTAGTYGLAWQDTNVTATAADATTVTLGVPYNTGDAVDRTVLFNGQARVLVAHVANGQYTLNRSWNPPVANTKGVIAGYGLTAASVWAGAASGRTVQIDVTQTLGAPRDISGAADNTLTIRDALVSAVVVAAGDAEILNGNNLRRYTPAGTLVASKALNSPDAPTSLT